MNGSLHTRTRLLLALPIAAAAISLAACAGTAGGQDGGSGRPSVDDVSVGITKILDDAGQSDLLTEDQITCISERFVDSKVSDEDLSNLAAGKDEQTSEDAKELVSQTMTEASTACAAE